MFLGTCQQSLSYSWWSKDISDIPLTTDSSLTCARYSRDSEKVAISSVNFLSFGKIFFYFFFDKLLDHYLIFPYLNSQIIWSSLDKRNNWSKKRFKKWNDICVVFIAHRLMLAWLMLITNKVPFDSMYAFFSTFES